MGARLFEVVSGKSDVDKESAHAIVEAILETGDMRCDICVAWQSALVDALRLTFQSHVWRVWIVLMTCISVEDESRAWNCCCWC